MTPSPSLVMLIERLRWPIPRVRWEAARQIAGLISAGDKAARLELLNWTRRQRLETDALTAVSLVHAFDLRASFSFDELNAAIQAPSTLSDALLLMLYPGNEGRLLTSRYQFSLEWAEDLPASRGFEDGIGTIVPLIFRSVLRSLQNRFGLPFLERWKAEWVELQRALPESYSDYPGFFLAGDRGCTTRADVRQRAVFVSAFLRTLAFAQVTWNMPWSEAVVAAEVALPFNDGLSKFLTSKRPKWSLSLLERVEKVGQAVLARKLWRGAAATLSRGFEPIALDVTDYDGQNAVRVEVQRAIQGRGADGCVSRSLGHPSWVTVEPGRYSLDGFLPSDIVWPEEGGLNTLTAVAHAHALGRAHIDIIVDRLQVVIPYLATGVARIRCKSDRIIVNDDEGLLSTLSLWYSNWQPTHPEDFAPVGHLTSCRSSAVRAFKKNFAVETPRLACVRTAKREYHHDPFKTKKTTYRL